MFQQNKYKIQIPAVYLLMSLLAISGCGPASVATENKNTYELIECVDPRPEMCIAQYAPVCAYRDTQVRCITTPCDSYEWKTYSNACTACSDPNVSGHYPDACDVMD